MNIYKVFIKFKSNNTLEIELKSDTNPRESLEKDWTKYKKDGALSIGNYIISLEDILWIKTEGNEIEKRSGKQLQSTGKKVK